MQRSRFGEFELDLDARQLRLHGEPVHLERRPFDLLALLVAAQGRVVTRDEIIAELWSPKVIIDFDSGVNTLVRKARSALGDTSDDPKFIETVAGKGYRFVAAVSSPTPPAATRRSSPWRHYSAVLVILVAAGAALHAFWPRDSLPEHTRIAVLPLENLTNNAELDFMAAGIAEETSIALAKTDLPGLSVIGVVSARALANSDVSLPEYGRELGVDLFVVSSLRLDANRIRVASRLLRVADSEQIWSATFDRELTNILALQRELSIAIAEQVRQQLSPKVAAAIDLRQTQNPEAYELYLKGRYEWTRFQPDSVQEAIRYYRLAVTEDPNYGLAWAGMAHALVTSVVTATADRETVLPAAQDALQHALELAPNLAETQLALGSFHFFMDRNLEPAEAAARRAVALDPNSAMSHMFLGIVLEQFDKHVEARAMLRRARELDPLFPLMFANSAVVALHAGEPLEAAEYATQAIAIDPEFWVGYLHLGTAQRMLGHYYEALQDYANAEKLSGGRSTLAASYQALVLVRLGRDDEARDILSRLLARSTEQYVPPFQIATIYAQLGEVDPAFEWLDRAVAGGGVSCSTLNDNPQFEVLRSDARYLSLSARCSNDIGWDDAD
ncbi:MAG: winged helix-turn-helix domain-containing protein [Gammaproteobacteria bacterium]